MFKLSDGEEIMTLAFFVLIQYRSVTDRQTDGRTDGQTDMPPLAIPAVSIARYANALVKTDNSEKCRITFERLYRPTCNS